MQIKIIRHSERLDYSNYLYWLFCFGQYQEDAPLTKKGHHRAYEKGKQIKSDSFHPRHLYTSPYSRTIATAVEIQKSFPQSQLIIEPLLSEYQPTSRHCVTLYPDGIPTTFSLEPTVFSYPESYERFNERIQFVINKLIEKHDDDLIIVTHGEVLKCFIAYLQSKFPDLLLDCGTINYLTVISFVYDKKHKEIIKSSISIET